MKKLLIVLVLGGALFYLFNPSNGDRHRSQIRSKAETLRKNSPQDAEPEAA